MNHYWTESRFEEGWFTYPKLYSYVVNKFPDGSHFVEVGSWKGRSAAYMAVEIENSGKNIKFDCVDTWYGSGNESDHQNDRYVQTDTLYEKFLENINPVKHIITPVRKLSVVAAADYENESLDFVFIDADHRYESVMEDLAAWFPKVKPGAIFAGHDYLSWEGPRRAVREFLGPGSDPFTDQHGLGYRSYMDSWGEGCWVVQKTANLTQPYKRTEQ